MLLRNGCQRVPEGQPDRSLARSAWDSATPEGRPGGYGMILRWGQGAEGAGSPRRRAPLSQPCDNGIGFALKDFRDRERARRRERERFRWPVRNIDTIEASDRLVAEVKTEIG